MTTYVGMQDLSKRTLQLRFDNAIATFEERRGYRPILVAVNEEQASEITAPADIELVGLRNVAANTFYLAKRDDR